MCVELNRRECMYGDKGSVTHRIEVMRGTEYMCQYHADNYGYPQYLVELKKRPRRFHAMYNTEWGQWGVYDSELQLFVHRALTESGAKFRAFKAAKEAARYS